MDVDVPLEWSTEACRSYTPADSDREMEYRTYRHESGDLRLKVAPASLDGESYPATPDSNELPRPRVFGNDSRQGSPYLRTL